MVTARETKAAIKKLMNEKGIGYYELSGLTKIEIVKLIYLIWIPFSRIKLTQGIAISKALSVKLSKLL